MQSALGVLESKAIFKGKEHEVFVRVAEAGGAIYLDLCDEYWRVARVTQDGWAVIHMADCPVYFRRPRGAKPLPIPLKNYSGNSGKIAEDLPQHRIKNPSLCLLADLIGVSTDSRDWRLIVGFLLSLLRGSIPYPVLVFNGEQGSGKSTRAKLIRALVDPNTTPLRSLPKERRDLFISATNSWIQCFDNVSGLPDWLSDDLCRLATGGGLATRELYTDQEETLLDARRPCVLNGITDFVTRHDLVDRAMLVTFPSIAEQDRQPEAALLADFDAIHLHALGELLDITAAGLRRLPHISLDRLPRMADFTLWVTACEEALGWEHGSFARDFTEARREMVSAALEEEPIVEPLRRLANYNEVWEGSATQLLEELVHEAGLKDSKRMPDAWPKNPASLGRKLKQLAPALRGENIDAKQLPVDSKGLRAWRVKRMRKNASVGPVTAVTRAAQDLLQQQQQQHYSSIQRHRAPCRCTRKPRRIRLTTAAAATAAFHLPNLTAAKRIFS